MFALQAGLCTLPLAVMTLIFASLSGRLMGSLGSHPAPGCRRRDVHGGSMLVGIDSETSLPWLLASYVVFGLGFGLVNAPTALSGIPRSQTGVAAAVASTSRQIGAALGVAVVGSVLSFGLAGSLRRGFVAASHPAWGILAGCELAVLGIGALTTGYWAAGTAGRTAHLSPTASEQSLLG